MLSDLNDSFGIQNTSSMQQSDVKTQQFNPDDHQDPFGKKQNNFMHKAREPYHQKRGGPPSIEASKFMPGSQGGGKIQV